MKRRDFLSGLIVAAAMAGPAAAQSVVESVVSQLRAQGFTSIDEERTLLGRVRIVAERDDGLREIIINPRTGEILRDLWTPSQGGPSAVKIIGESEGSGRSGGGQDGDGKGDDGGNQGDDGDDDDNDDDDNSGSGGGDHDGGDDHGGDDGDKGGGEGEN